MTQYPKMPFFGHEEIAVKLSTALLDIADYNGLVSLLEYHKNASLQMFERLQTKILYIYMYEFSLVNKIVIITYLDI